MTALGLCNRAVRYTGLASIWCWKYCWQKLFTRKILLTPDFTCMTESGRIDRGPMTMPRCEKLKRLTSSPPPLYNTINTFQTSPMMPTEIEGTHQIGSTSLYTKIWKVHPYFSLISCPANPYSPTHAQKPS